MEIDFKGAVQNALVPSFFTEPNEIEQWGDVPHGGQVINLTLNADGLRSFIWGFWEFNGFLLCGMMVLASGIDN